MGRKRSIGASLSLDPWLIGYATVVFWVQFAAGSWFSGTTTSDSELLRKFAIAAAAIQVALSAAYFAILRLSPKAEGRLGKPSAVRAATAASFFAPAGVLVLLFQSQWYVLAGLAFGIGCIASYVMWGQLMSRNNFASLLANTLLGQAVGAILVYAASLLRWDSALILIAGSLAVSSLCLIVCLTRTSRSKFSRSDTESLRQDDDTAGDPAEIRPLEGRALPAITRKDVLPFLLIFASSVVAAMNSCGYDSTEGWTRFGSNAIVVPFLMSLVAAVFLYLYLVRGVGLYYCFVAFPLLAGAAVVLQLLPLPEGFLIVRDISFALSYLSNLFGFVFLCMLSRRSGKFSPDILIALRAIMAAAMLVSYGFVSYGLGSFVTGFAQGVLFVSLLFGAGVSYLGASGKSKDHEERQTVAFAALAQTWKLSKRETEIAEWLLKGYQAPYIAQQFFISENTVRTHIKSMYRKMGVANRNEFLASFESTDLEA